MLKITLKKSIIGNTPANRRTVKALGLGRTGRTVYQKDSPSVRGMIRNVGHLLLVEVVDSAPEKKTVSKVVAQKVAPIEKKPATKKAAPKATEKELVAPAKAAKKPAKKTEA